jgi:hypothetical protein
MTYKNSTFPNPMPYSNLPMCISIEHTGVVATLNLFNIMAWFPVLLSEGSHSYLLC